MHAGMLRHRITIQRMEVTEDAYGALLPPEWADVATVWASVEPLRGGESSKVNLPQKVALPQKIAGVDARIRLRYREGLNPATDRVVHKGVAYNITGVIHDNWMRETQLMVTATALEQPEGGRVNA